MAAPSITPPPPDTKPRLAVYKFSSCDGCQLSLLNLEEQLLSLVSAVEIAYFLEARRRVLPPPYDVGLVEGSISTPEEEHRIRQARRDCKFLVAIGACATSGGIQALRNWANLTEYMGAVYPSPQYIKSLETATPIASHVFVDFELRGCPVNPIHLLELISAMLAGRKPNIPTYSLCIQCKRLGYPCVMVAGGQPCLGPITQAGCGALCPGCHRACYGCFGPMEQPNMPPLSRRLESLGLSARDVKRRLRSFNGYLEPFKQTSDHYEQLEQHRQW
ncbi:MAG: oxidoreductase [Tepidisphaeraceae bacterium]|jgi:coenzyme F420-reducing hydrogenase gamma subunit